MKWNLSSAISNAVENLENSQISIFYSNMNFGPITIFVDFLFLKWPW